MTDPQKPRVRTLETPMMPENVRIDTVPPSRVGVVEPTARNYVHPAQNSSKGALIVMSIISAVLMLVLIGVGVLFLTGHLTLQ